ncbi:hypothetical protein QUF75_06785 [Desulfococcaceae bacterium HSG7]|nr:hypothetical protein [Desulfococcaceae bacterium HSG9]MDM8554419.1 hypothetical protein [Desulfococcaceae bacterium HSG7]
MTTVCETKEFPQEEDWFELFNLWVDLGFLGIKKDYKSASINIPHKNQENQSLPCLMKEQKEENRKISKAK